jgi:hypothetical protein
MSTTAILDGLAGLTADELEKELDRLTLTQRLVRSLLSARRRVETQQRQWAEWDREEQERGRGAAGATA